MALEFYRPNDKRVAASKDSSVDNRAQIEGSVRTLSGVVNMFRNMASHSLVVSEKYVNDEKFRLFNTAVSAFSSTASTTKKMPIESIASSATAGVRPKAEKISSDTQNESDDSKGMSL